MATKTTTKRSARKTTGRKKRGAIKGQPITELAENYIDTEGEAMPDAVEGLSINAQAAKDKRFLERQKAKQEREAAKNYHGPAIPATKVYRRDMPAFKNCQAECWMLINESQKTYTFANTYNGLLKSSYQADHYTWVLSDKAQKKIAKKQEEMIEVEVTEWPTWIVNSAATARRTRRASKDMKHE